MIRMAPGGPFDAEKQLPPDLEANLRAAYHLDEPLYQQFGRYLWGLDAGRFRPVVPVSRFHGDRTDHDRLPGVAAHRRARNAARVAGRYHRRHDRGAQAELRGSITAS